VFWRLFPLVVAGLALWVVAPSLWTGWYADDAFYWALPGTLAAAHESLGAAMWHAFTLWLVGNARFYPGLVVEKYLVFATFTNLLAYKVFLVALTLLTVELFRRCVAAYASLPVGNLAALVACACFQERAYHDALLSYNGMPQVVAIVVLLSLLAFVRALDGGRRGWYVLAGALYVVAALTYEDVYAFGLIYVALARLRGRTWGAAWRAAAAPLALGALLVALAVVLHAVFPPRGLYALSFAPGPVLRAAFEQIVAAFPVVYWAADPNGIFGRVNLDDFLRNAPLDPLLFLAFAVAGWFALRRVTGEVRQPAPLAGIGALVIVLAALPVAILAKYQQELRLGWAYLPVLIEYLGVALVLVAGLLALLQLREQRALTIACALTLGLIAAMTQATNVQVARLLAPQRDAELALQRSLQGGLLRGVRDGATVAVPPASWIAYDGGGPDGISSSGVFYAYAHVRVQVVPPQPGADVALSYNPSTRTWSEHIWRRGDSNP
jgi:hypothetical protein